MGRFECNDDKAKKVRRPVFVTTPDLVVSKSPATGIRISVDSAAKAELAKDVFGSGLGVGFLGLTLGVPGHCSCNYGIVRLSFGGIVALLTICRVYFALLFASFVFQGGAGIVLFVVRPPPWSPVLPPISHCRNGCFSEAGPDNNWSSVEHLDGGGGRGGGARRAPARQICQV